MTDLMPFAYGEQPVRIVVIDGEPWFVLADLCKVLGLTNPNMVAERLDQVNLSQADVENSRGQMRRTLIVSEPGMYEVVIRSDKPEAVAFRRWITSKVLPAIRKTGSYGAPRQLTQDEIVHQALQITAARVEQLEAEVAELTPGATKWAAYADADGSYSINAVAKIIGTGRVRLMARMREDEILNLDNLPRQQHLDAGRFEVKVGSWAKPDGRSYVSRSTRVTAKGADWLIGKYREPGMMSVLDGGRAIS